MQGATSNTSATVIVGTTFLITGSTLSIYSDDVSSTISAVQDGYTIVQHHAYYEYVEFDFLPRIGSGYNAIGFNGFPAVQSLQFLY